ncbi:MAG TPA: RES family NAD+ phosphorylase [Terracidiphilus sp.]|jgi:RES domain-containing protein|nr:RES family NAD+ phosphorylase [Terracidiphilus sp.]
MGISDRGLMKTYWRISNHTDLGGWGGRKFASRWSSLGKRIVYMAESPAGAMLEVLVHLQDKDDQLPSTFSLLEIESPEDAGIRELLPLAEASWKGQPDLTRQIGDAWLASRETPLARVPSAIMPRTWNLLLNPEHSDASRIKIVSTIRERFDNRLFRFGAP